MPTCSTSKLPAKYQTGGGGLFHKRYRRPQSCKYDTYRVRSRRSQVKISQAPQLTVCSRRVGEPDQVKMVTFQQQKCLKMALIKSRMGFWQVDETLFGEPLSRQLLNRSKSMEAISGGGEISPQNQYQKSKSKSISKIKIKINIKNQNQNQHSINIDIHFWWM